VLPFRPKLKGTLFQKDLGTIYDKNLRVEALTPALADAMGFSAAKDTAAAAAALCKADLATSTVTEMTALAGTMGRHYALKQGLPQDVATAVFEAVLPRQAGDVLPATAAGIVVAVADRLDSLVGLVAAVGAPSATADPYGLRRAAYGMLQVGVVACRFSPIVSYEAYGMLWVCNSFISDVSCSRSKTRVLGGRHATAHCCF
jgi:glycyl-tRNA synthetase